MEITRKEALVKRGAEKRNCSAQHAAAIPNGVRSARERQRGREQPRPAPACAATGRCGKRFRDHSYGGGGDFRRPRNTAKRRTQTPPPPGASFFVRRFVRR